jgi:hypothetical protein
MEWRGDISWSSNVYTIWTTILKLKLYSYAFGSSIPMLLAMTAPQCPPVMQAKQIYICL